MQVPFTYKLLLELSTLMEGNFGVYLFYPYDSQKVKTTYLHNLSTYLKHQLDSVFSRRYIHQCFHQIRRVLSVIHQILKRFRIMSIHINKYVDMPASLVFQLKMLNQRSDNTG